MNHAANMMSETAVVERIEVDEQCRERICCDALLPALGEGGLWLVGCSELAGHYVIERRFARVHTFLLTLEGEGALFGPEGAVTLSAGQWALIPAGHALQYYLPSDSPRWRLLWVLMHSGPVWDGAAHGWRHGCTSQHPQLLHTFENLFAEQERFADPALSSLLVQQFGLYLHRLIDKGERARPGELQWQTLAAALSAELGRAWSVAQMAQILHLSARQLHRLCREQGKTTPMGLLGQLRLREAALLLASTRLPLKVVAARCGFANEYHFSTAFKRRYGLAPSHYRQRQHPAWRESSVSP